MIPAFLLASLVLAITPGPAAGSPMMQSVVLGGVWTALAGQRAAK
jgi:hypothetical protein